MKSGDDNMRRILLGEDNPFGNNKITNTKYTALTFLPKNLLLQFGTFMNCYFLVIACLQLINELAPVSPITIWLPLIFVFMISAIKGIFHFAHFFIGRFIYSQRLRMISVDPKKTRKRTANSTP
jgi:hypothetical protein